MKGDVINLTFPAKPDYILAVRLAVSAIAERAGFSIDDIEDLKAASAEACILLLSESPDTIMIAITVMDGVKLDFSASGNLQENHNENEQNDLSQYLLEALVDTCEINRKNNVIETISFYKKL